MQRNSRKTNDGGGGGGGEGGVGSHSLSTPLPHMTQSINTIEYNMNKEIPIYQSCTNHPSIIHTRPLIFMLRVFDKNLKGGTGLRWEPWRRMVGIIMGLA
jgi:hypothetical protein